MKRNYYNIIKDGEIVHKGITSSEVTKITGITNVFQYATKGSVRDGQTIELSHQVTRSVSKEKLTLSKWTQEQIDAWNEIRKAAELLKTGKGKIVRKKVNGKWTGYVEEIK